MDFTTRYNSLNDAQRMAVDTLSGPVMVIAGPGTGKTELLSIRTANILKTTDTLPENILCLTFTESGAHAMRERLAGIIGKDAYKVAIHTFHSFGSAIINQYGEFFYEGAQFRPADELSRYEIVHGIFETLGHSNILNKKMNGEFTYIYEAITVLSELKKSGLTSDELLEILDANDHTIDKVEQLLAPVFADRISKKTVEQASFYTDIIRTEAQSVTLPNIVPLAHVLSDSLQTAVEEAERTGKTSALTAWKNAWLIKNDKGIYILKSRERQTKLRVMSSIYEQYLARMQEAELYDFDDMILRVVHAMEIFDDLRFNLQEKYQYVMVDEFQDTNMAQMRIVHNLTNNIAHEDTPNIMVVGDDDQAIFSFQGADISNILNFRDMYAKTKLITLTDNYRSGDPILSESRGIITQGTERLESEIKELNKQLTAKAHRPGSSVSLIEAETASDERSWVVTQISQLISSGTAAHNIAVITRKHREIETLLPYFVRKGIAVQYERRDNVLDMPPIVILELLARVLIAISRADFKAANALLPELLSHPAWGIAPESLWSISLTAYTERTSWLEELATSEGLADLQKWLIETAYSVPHTSLELILDTMIGAHTLLVDDSNNDESEPHTTEKHVFISPLYEYYFGDASLAAHTSDYIEYLEGLRAIRTKLREYQPGKPSTLETFIEFVQLHRSIGSGITSVRASNLKDNAVQLMTAHKSKGLEFEHVYIIDALDTVWGERARVHNRIISYPENLRLAPVGDSADERLRLFYVAATRAKHTLAISYSNVNDAGKAVERAGFLIGTDPASSLQPTRITHDSSQETLRELSEVRWFESLVQPISPTLKELLAPQLESYKLSVTHLTNFLDVTRGGPQNFLMQNLLRFPQAMSPASAYGSAIHRALQRAHAHLISKGNRQPIEDVIAQFESALADQRLSDTDMAHYTQKGSDELHAFLSARYDSFTTTQKPEYNFTSQHVLLGDAHLSGALDVVDVDNSKNVIVTDYKTGKPLKDWKVSNPYDKVKLHKYRQQLLFYKLLVENARDYRGHNVQEGRLQFIQPTASDEIVALTMTFDSAEIERMKQLIQAVWKHIVTLDLPDVSGYEQSIKGIEAFEQDLIDGNI